LSGLGHGLRMARASRQQDGASDSTVVSIAIALCVCAAGCAGGIVAGPDGRVGPAADATDAGGLPPADGGEEPDPCLDGGPCEEPEPIDIDAGEEPDVDAGPVADADAATMPDPDAATPRDSGAPADSGAVVRPTPTCANVNQRLRDDFGIIIRPGTLPFSGLPSEDIGCADRIKVYQMFIRPFQYERFGPRVDPSVPFTMHLYRTGTGSTASCSAYVPNANAIQIRDLSDCLRVVSGPSDPDFNRIAMFLIHETGHIIRARTPSLGTSFQNARLAAQDPACYDRGFIVTYSLRTTNPISESMAEAIGLFVVNRKVGRYGTISNFRTECPHTYAWVRTNIFGNLL